MTDVRPAMEMEGSMTREDGGEGLGYSRGLEGR